MNSTRKQFSPEPCSAKSKFLSHESGIFRYFTVKADGEIKEDYINFEALLVKRGTWKTLMEYQKSQASKMEWDALK